MAKKQKPTKKVNFFCLRPENVVDLEDIDSQQQVDDGFTNCDIDEVNRSIQQHQTQGSKLKRNNKSFNYCPDSLKAGEADLAKLIMAEENTTNLYS